MRKEIIEKKRADIIDTINIVSYNFPHNFLEFHSLGLVKDGLYKRLEYAIESVLDICSVINSDLNLGFPETEDNIIDHLESKKIFDKKTVNIIREMKKFRNVLVHKYGDIDDKKAFEDIKKGLKDFEIIISEIEKFLKKHRKEEISKK